MRVDLEWGLQGVVALRKRASVLVIVDVLSFSTAVSVAVAAGAVVYPFPYGDLDAAREAAVSHGAELAWPRGTAGAQFSLSPTTLQRLSAGSRIVLPSPNGSRLSLQGGGVPVLAGCLRNASAVAEAAKVLSGDGVVGLVAAGERWADGSLRPALEDYLGAGVIADRLGLPCSAEAELARIAARAAGGAVPSLVQDSISGRELCAAGFGGDVKTAIGTDVETSVPILNDGAYRAFDGV